MSFGQTPVGWITWHANICEICLQLFVYLKLSLRDIKKVVFDLPEQKKNIYISEVGQQECSDLVQSKKLGS